MFRFTWEGGGDAIAILELGLCGCWQGVSIGERAGEAGGRRSRVMTKTFDKWNSFVEG
jgi:hypothetical protein